MRRSAVRCHIIFLSAGETVEGVMNACHGFRRAQGFAESVQHFIIMLAVKVSCVHININGVHLGLHFSRTFERCYVLKDTQVFCSTTPLGGDQSCFNIISVLQKTFIINI